MKKIIGTEKQIIKTNQIRKTLIERFSEEEIQYEIEITEEDGIEEGFTFDEKGAREFAGSILQQDQAQWFFDNEMKAVWDFRKDI